MKKTNTLEVVNTSKKRSLASRQLSQTKRQTKNDLLNWIMLEDKQVKNFTQLNPMQDNTLARELKDNKVLVKTQSGDFKLVNDNSNIIPIVRASKKSSKLGSLTIYKDRSQLSYNSGLLEDYNKINPNKGLIKISTIKNLEGLYNSLYSVLYNGQTRRDLFNIYKTYYASTIARDGLKRDLKDLIEFENSIHYFIINILDNKIQSGKLIKRDYVYNLYLRFITNNPINNLQELETINTNGDLIKTQLEEIVNNKYIIEKLNSTGKLDKLIKLMQDKEETIRQYKENRDNLKQGIIDKDKAQLSLEYKKTLTNINNKIKTIKKDIKLDLYLE